MDYSPLYRRLRSMGAEQWAEELPQLIEHAFDSKPNGQQQQLCQVVDRIPPITTRHAEYASRLAIGAAEDIDAETQQQLKQHLQMLMPWRKGPLELFGIPIDTEWRSDWKWDRLKNHISPLNGRFVLDVGCGNGYHCWRMLGAGADMVVGIDPTILSVLQFQVVKKMQADAPVFVLPLGIEHMPAGNRLFDTVFSMGVLYHRRSPIDHLMELKGCLRNGGELLLETLVIEGKKGESLVPAGRYAQMRNVWFIPSVDTLVGWMQRCGFQNIQVIDVTKTTTEEQRRTDWMTSYSLTHFLDPENPGLTCEGYPAPVRAMILATI